MRQVNRIGAALLVLSAIGMTSGCSYSKDSASRADGYRGDARADVLTPAEPMAPAAEPVAPIAPPADVAKPAPVAPPPPVVAPEPAPQATYTIKQGDNLWQIAKTHYGDGQKWKQIVDANPGLNPDKLQVGKKIVLP